jgi:dienelactone hydrolase
MAGNVKEWCLNASSERRYILGGSSTEPVYMYTQPDARLPFDRSTTNGFRLVKYPHASPIAGRLAEPVAFPAIDNRNAKPVSDSVFRIYAGLYSYDLTPLDAKIESEDDSSPYWRRQRITFNAAYGNERVIAYLLLPKNSAPPYQTVVFFPGAEARAFHSFEDTQLSLADFVVKSGRALLFPEYKGTLERLGKPVDRGTIADRDLTIQQAKDLRRSMDYLETRPEIDRDRLAYYGFSWGGQLGPIMLTVDDRFKVAVFASGGLSSHWKPLPEVDPVNFAPHVKIPVLMINGRYDFAAPFETSSQPLFRLLGTPPADKRQVVLESGHGLPFTPWFKETLDWLDHYLGRVK